MLLKLRVRQNGFSGEVEDFKTQITHPPKGEFKETSGLQGAKQTATVAFTARGLQGYSLTESAKLMKQ